MGFGARRGLKVTSPDGEGLKVTGEVVNNDGAKVADITTGDRGMGKFKLHPEKGKTYKAILHFGQETIEKPIPAAKDSGFVLTASALGEKYIAVKVEGTAEEGAKKGFLVGHVRGAVFITQAANATVLEALIAKEDVPEGIVTLTWFDEEGRPQCERLVFNERPDLEVALEVNGLQDTYGKRELVSFNIQPELGEEPNMIMSVAITDKAKIHHDADGNNIKSYLLLDSDLRGEIAHPGHYFDEGNSHRLEDLDNLLLTQGWRRFTWKEVIEATQDAPIFPLEASGFSLKGIATDFYNTQKALVKGKITLTATDRKGGIFLAESMTDSIGSFAFDSLDFYDSTNLIFQTPRELKDNKNLKKKVESGEVNASSKIILQPYVSPEVGYVFEPKDLGGESMKAFLEEMKKIREVELAFGGEDVVVLKEIKVESGRLMEYKRFEPAGKIYSHADIRLDVDSMSQTGQYNSVFNLFNGIPGLRVIELTTPNSAQTVYEVQIRSKTSLTGPIFPLYLINGAPADVELVKALPVSRIDFIDILTGAGAAIYGSRGAGGVVAIYLKDEKSLSANYEAKGVASFVHSGYYQSREFYSPDYSRKADAHSRPDFRPTLFWRAGLTTSELEPASVGFYTSDVASEFEVWIEGITLDGRPFVKIETFKVN
ncbi:MAG: TonB-dependent receptor plug domain-containing protein [Imperialibacter sp.]|uniref:TonB-dependent receptor n=1 Tax=Imperialibacter sp. TaxID=2038411 RepID=UPI0032EB680D